MTADHRATQLLKRFAITFALAAAAIGGGVLVTRLSSRNEASESSPTASTAATTLAASGPPDSAEASESVGTDTSSAGGTAPDISATDTSAAEVSATDTSEPDVSEPGVSEPADPTATFQELPRPDVAAFCVASFGAEGAATGTADTPDVACLPPNGGNLIEVSIDEVCALQVGEGSRSVRLHVGESSLRCSTPVAPIVATLDFDAYCPLQYGRASQATRIADDYLGWKCAVIKNGVFETYSIDVDLACQTVVGRQTFAEFTDKSTSGWKCYGLP